MLTFAALWYTQYVIGDYTGYANQEFWSWLAALDPSSPFRLRVLNGSSCPIADIPYHCVRTDQPVC